MSKKLLISALSAALILVGLGVATNYINDHSLPHSQPTTTPTAGNSPSLGTDSRSDSSPIPTTSSTASATDSSILTSPIAGFKERITKKSFGQYVTPGNSPVSPERFTGYHTAVDIEYADVASDISVVSAAPGTVVRSDWVAGYGGLVVIEGSLNNEPAYYIYGHLRPSSLIAKNVSVKKGQPIGLLGTGYTPETDNERRHLHFAIIKGTSLDIRGYVPNRSELSKWIDPMTVLK